MLYIGWEVCQEWFHPECSGITVEEAADIETFYCSSCKTNSNENKDRDKPNSNESISKSTLTEKSDSIDKVKSQEKKDRPKKSIRARATNKES